MASLGLVAALLVQATDAGNARAAESAVAASRRPAAQPVSLDGLRSVQPIGNLSADAPAGAPSELLRRAAQWIDASNPPDLRLSNGTGSSTGSSVSPAAVNASAVNSPLGVEVRGSTADLDAIGVQSQGRDLGAGFVRRNKVSWATIEKVRGVYDFSSTDADLSWLAGLNARPIVVVQDTPDWARTSVTATLDGPFSAAFLPDYARFWQALVSRYSQPPYNVHYWELYNEPDNTSSSVEGDLGRFGATPSAYAALLQAAYPAIKGADASATVIFGGLAFDFFNDAQDATLIPLETGGAGIFQRDFLDQVLAAGAGPYFDALAFHYFRDYDARWLAKKPGMNAIAGKAAVLQDTLAKHGLSKPLYLTELGFPSAPIGGTNGTEDLQARQLVELFARALSANAQAVIWYRLADYLADQQVTSNDFIYHGLIASNGKPKAAYTTFKVAESLLGGAQFVRALSAGELGSTNAEGYVFRQADGSALFVIWTNTDAGVTVTVTADGPKTVTRKDGTTQTVSGSTVGVTADPIFVAASANATVGPADLALIGRSSPNPVQGGAVLLYTFNVTNTGPSPATGVVFTDTLPSGVESPTGTSSQGTCLVASGAVQCAIGSLAVGASSTVTVTVVAPPLATVIQTTATVAANQPDPNSANNSATVAATVLAPPPDQAPPRADLLVARVGQSPTAATVGDVVTYTVDVQNLGPDATEGVRLRVRDGLPAQLPLASGSTTQGAGCTNSLQVQCLLGILLAQGTARVTLVVTATATGEFPMTFVVDGSSQDPNATNNSQSLTTTVGTPPVITAVSPNGGLNTGIVHLTILGAGFVDGMTAQLVPSGGTPLALQNVATSGAFTLTADVPAGTPVGSYDVRVATPNGKSTIKIGAYRATSGEPIATRLTPAQAFTTFPIPLAIDGANFQPGITVTYRLSGTTGADQPLLRLERIADSRLQGYLPASLAEGTYQVILRNLASPVTASLSYNALAPSRPEVLTADDYLGVSSSTIRTGDQVQLRLALLRLNGSGSSAVPVQFFDGDPSAGGTLIGQTVVSVAPGGYAYATIPWSAGSTPRDVRLVAIINPPAGTDTDPGNNRASRVLTILPRFQDTTPPVLRSATIDNGARQAITTSVTIQTVAEDAGLNATGLATMRVLEYTPFSGIGSWDPRSDSGWVPYSANLPFTLTNLAGVRYLVVFVADRGGNISNAAYAVISYVPPTDTLLFPGEFRVYRYTLTAGQTMTTTVHPLTGDPDLAVWGPSAPGHPSPLYGFSGTIGSGDEQVVFTAVSDGTYQVEVVATTINTQFALTVATSTEGAVTAASKSRAVRASDGRTPPSSPVVPLDSAPPDNVTVPPAPVTEVASDKPVYHLFLPVFPQEWQAGW